MLTLLDPGGGGRFRPPLVFRELLQIPQEFGHPTSKVGLRLIFKGGGGRFHHLSRLSGIAPNSAGIWSHLLIAFSTYS